MWGKMSVFLFASQVLTFLSAVNAYVPAQYGYVQGPALTGHLYRRQTDVPSGLVQVAQDAVRRAAVTNGVTGPSGYQGYTQQSTRSVAAQVAAEAAAAAVEQAYRRSAGAASAYGGGPYGNDFIGRFGASAAAASANPGGFHHGPYGGPYGPGAYSSSAYARSASDALQTVQAVEQAYRRSQGSETSNVYGHPTALDAVRRTHIPAYTSGYGQTSPYQVPVSHSSPYQVPYGY